MPNVTLEGIAALLKVELDPITKTLAENTKTLALHTAALETLLTEKKKRDDNKTVGDSRLEYLENWAKQVSQKLGINFKP